MNVKIHTPKSLKMGSGMATLKQFLLSLVATTISIVLTFGTAAWLNDKKKEEAKREMVIEQHTNKRDEGETHPMPADDGRERWRPRNLSSEA